MGIPDEPISISRVCQAPLNPVREILAFTKYAQKCNLPQISVDTRAHVVIMWRLLSRLVLFARNVQEDNSGSKPN